ncbi:MAG: hypothetical protein JNJ61_09680 [Anaerolineae bacterium]|nr:hypothetical protein [Anaerolineae bacterium]
MNSYVDQLATEKLREELFNAYATAPFIYPETDKVQRVKQELRRRGCETQELVTIAVAALLRNEPQ